MKNYMKENQLEMARLLGVHRSSMRQFQAEGMPYIAAGNGKAASYVVPLCFHWLMGREALREIKPKRGFSNDPLFRILFSYCVALEGITLATWKKRAWELAKAGGYQRDDFFGNHRDLARCRISGCIRDTAAR